MNAKIATLLSVVIISCSEEEALVKKPEPLPETTLQFQSSSLTILEGHNAGLCGELVPVVILTSEAPISPTLYYVIMKYNATDLGGGTFDSRFFFDAYHTKFDGTVSIPVVLTNSLDESGMLTTVIQMEFERAKTSSNFIIGAVNNSKSETDEIAKLEVTTTNPVSGVSNSQLTIGTRKSIDVTIKDFN